MYWSVACALVLLGPPLPKKQPSQFKMFEEELDNRLHSNLITCPKSHHPHALSHNSLLPLITSISLLATKAVGSGTSVVSSLTSVSALRLVEWSAPA